jgi:3-hydroxyacyl-[acyl-carrier-protein] dehydratase
VRYLLFDRVTSIELGKRISCVKCFSMQDESLREHFRKRALVPGSLVIEAMLQTLGWLVIRTTDFHALPLFTMLEDCVVPPELEPGVKLEITGELVSMNPKASVGRAEVSLDGKVIASIGRVMLVHFPSMAPEGLRDLFASYAGLA